MGYVEHLISNIRVALRCFVLAVFHLVHGIVPCKIKEFK